MGSLVNQRFENLYFIVNGKKDNSGKLAATRLLEYLAPVRRRGMTTLVIETTQSCKLPSVRLAAVKALRNCIASCRNWVSSSGVDGASAAQLCSG